MNVPARYGDKWRSMVVKNNKLSFACHCSIQWTNVHKMISLNGIYDKHDVD